MDLTPLTQLFIADHYLLVLIRELAIVRLKEGYAGVYQASVRSWLWLLLDGT